MIWGIHVHGHHLFTAKNKTAPGVWLQFDPEHLAGRRGGRGDSPVELVVVVMGLPPEVEPDQQQTEGKEEDEGPQQLPLRTHTHTSLI